MLSMVPWEGWERWDGWGMGNGGGSFGDEGHVLGNEMGRGILLLGVVLARESLHSMD